MTDNESHCEFVDTNILIYAIDNSAGDKHRIAVELMTRLWMDHRGCLSLQVLQQFYVSATRKLILTPELAALQISRLSRWRVYRPTVDDILSATGLHQTRSVSFWDGLILRSAQAARCSVLWSEHLSHGQLWGNLEVRNPFKPSTIRQ